MPIGNEEFFATGQAPSTATFLRSDRAGHAQNLGFLHPLPKTRARPAIFILDPSLTDVRGHHFQSLQDLIRALAPVEPVIVVNAEMDRQLIAPHLKVHGLFKRTVYDEPGIGPRPDGRLQRRIWKLRRAGRDASAVGRRLLARVLDALPLKVQVSTKWLSRVSRPLAQWPDLEAVFSETDINTADHIVLPTAEANLVFELVDALARRAPECRPQLHARLMSSCAAAVRRDLSNLFERLSADPDLAGRVHIYCETPAMCRYLAAAYGAKTDLFPYLLAQPLRSNGGKARIMPRPIMFAYLGTARNEKGFGRLPEILRTVAANRSTVHRNVSFLVQVGGTDVRAAKLIEKFRSEVSSLLPYTSDRYQLSGSGILFEAISLAKPFICSAGMSFADYARDGNAIEAADDSEFATAILTMAAKPEPYFTAARRSSKVYATALRSNMLLQRLTAVERAHSAAMGSIAPN
jgi:hypothetical protein